MLVNVLYYVFSVFLNLLVESTCINYLCYMYIYVLNRLLVGNKYLIFYQFYEMLRRPVNNIVLFLKVPNFLRNSGAVT